MLSKDNEQGAVTVVVFVLLLLLTWAGPVGAEDCNKCVELGDSTASCTLLYCPNTIISITSEPDYCLAQMEAAMRAMEEFTPKPFNPTDMLLVDPLVLNYCSLDRTCVAERELRNAQDNLALAKRRDQAMSQWAVVKRECWRQP